MSLVTHLCKHGVRLLFFCCKIKKISFKRVLSLVSMSPMFYSLETAVQSLGSHMDLNHSKTPSSSNKIISVQLVLCHDKEFYFYFIFIFYLLLRNSYNQTAAVKSPQVVPCRIFESNLSTSKLVNQGVSKSNKIFKALTRNYY